MLRRRDIECKCNVKPLFIHGESSVKLKVKN